MTTVRASESVHRGCFVDDMVLLILTPPGVVTDAAPDQARHRVCRDTSPAVDGRSFDRVPTASNPLIRGVESHPRDRQRPNATIIGHQRGVRGLVRRKRVHTYVAKSAERSTPMPTW